LPDPNPKSFSFTQGKEEEKKVFQISCFNPALAQRQIKSNLAKTNKLPCATHKQHVNTLYSSKKMWQTNSFHDIVFQKNRHSKLISNTNQSALKKTKNKRVFSEKKQKQKLFSKKGLESHKKKRIRASVYGS